MTNENNRLKYVMRTAVRLLAVAVMLMVSATAGAQSVTPAEVSTWDALKSAIESATSDAPVNVVMMEDIGGSGGITVANEARSTVSLDLNGHQLSSEFMLSTSLVSFTVTDNSEAKNGCITTDWSNTNAPFNITASDCSITITDVNIRTVKGPCIYFSASGCNLTMTGGSLESPGWSSSVVEFNGGSNNQFTMHDGTIRGGEYSVKMHSDNDNAFIVSGNPIFEDYSKANVKMSNAPIYVDGPLATTARISIYTDQSADDVSGMAITSGLNTSYGSATNFSINGRSDLKIMAYDGEIYFGQQMATNDAGGTLGKWCSYYNSSQRMRACSGVTAYKAKVNAAKTGVALTELFTDGGIIKEDEGVLLKSDGDIVLMKTDDDADGDYTGNELTGADDDADQNENDGKCYVLSMVDDTFGFFLLESGVQTLAHKAYLIVDTGAGSRGFLSIGDDGATEINEVKNEGVNSETFATAPEWYDLFGRRIEQPTRRGVYVRDGKKHVVK